MTRGLDWRRHRPVRYSASFNVYDLYREYWSHIPWSKFYAQFLMMVALGVLVPCTNCETGTFVIDEDRPMTKRLEQPHV